MENKYYTPNPEDIYSSYECEMLLPTNDEDGETDYDNQTWQKISLHYKCPTFDGPYFDLDGGIYEDIVQGKVRTPYLTTEQIQKEGWVYKSENGLVIHHRFEKYNYIIHWYWIDKKIIISKKRDLYDNHYIIDMLYDGFCPSINEFRTIMKLLNIK